MPFHQRKDEPIVEFIFVGKVTFSSALDELRDFYACVPEGLLSNYGVLVELTSAKLEISYEEMREIVRCAQAWATRSRKIAICCESALNYGTARMFQSVHQNGANLVKISSNRAELIAWLKEEAKASSNISA